jgi:hypothetical protein
MACVVCSKAACSWAELAAGGSVCVASVADLIGNATRFRVGPGDWAYCPEVTTVVPVPSPNGPTTEVPSLPGDSFGVWGFVGGKSPNKF